MIQIICPICLGLAEPSAWARQAEIPLQECRTCGRIWAEEDSQRLWNKYQIDGKGQTRNHLGKVFDD
jgi:hypothetical protein